MKKFINFSDFLFFFFLILYETYFDFSLTVTLSLLFQVKITNTDNVPPICFSEKEKGRLWGKNMKKNRFFPLFEMREEEEKHNCESIKTISFQIR